MNIVQYVYECSSVGRSAGGHMTDEQDRILPCILISPNFTDSMKNLHLRNGLVEGSTLSHCLAVPGLRYVSNHLICRVS